MRHPDLTLDNTLRYLVLSLRKDNPLLAIEFVHRGKKWRADTPEEAMALREKLEAEDSVHAYTLHGSDAEEFVLNETKWTPDRFYGLVSNLGPLQKRFLAVLVLSQGNVSAVEACRKTGTTSLLGLAGVQSKLVRQVRALELEPSDLYTVQINWTEGERKRYFTLNSDFRVVAQDNDWPTEDMKRVIARFSREETDAPSTKKTRK
jgi:hypothetical protein